MTHLNSHRTAAAKPQPPMGTADLDGLLIDEEFDETLDRQIAELRESLADFPNL
jgi:hypothetical protein